MRDRFFVAAVVCLLCVLLSGYAYVSVTGHSFSRINFGLGPIEPAGASPFVDRAIENRVLRGWAQGQPQARLKNFLRDEFLGFDRALLGYSGAVSKTNAWFYATFLPRQAIIPVGVDTGNAFQDPAADTIVTVLLGNAASLDRVPGQVADAKRLISQFPNVNFTYYGVSEWTMTKPAVEAGYSDPTREAWPTFTSGLRGSAVTGLFNADDWDTNFFATDHHWNPVGQYQGYLDVMELLARRNPRVGTERLPFSETTVAGIDFRGAAARKAAYYRMSEPFRFLTGRDPELRAYLNGRRLNRLITPVSLLKKPKNARFAMQYAIYNGQDYPLIEYRKAAPGAGNLLILADSFSNSMEDLVASHYQNTYSVDLRHYQPETGRPFDIAAFIAEHDITDVLIMGRPARVLTVPNALLTGRPIR